MAASFQTADDVPMSEINTTPLVDVMLVLLIMFIITVPVASHKVPMDTPTGDGVPPVVHRLSLDAAGRTFWNGEPVGAEALEARLAAHVADPARPALQMSADAEARYERFDQLLAQIRRAGVTNVGFDNARFAGAI